MGCFFPWFCTLGYSLADNISEYAWHTVTVWEVRVDEIALNSTKNNDPDNVYNQSIGILAAAKKQLVGY